MSRTFKTDPWWVRLERARRYHAGVTESHDHTKGGCTLPGRIARETKWWRGCGYWAHRTLEYTCQCSYCHLDYDTDRRIPTERFQLTEGESDYLDSLEDRWDYLLDEIQPRCTACRRRIKTRFALCDEFGCFYQNKDVPQAPYSTSTGDLHVARAA